MKNIDKLPVINYFDCVANSEDFYRYFRHVFQKLKIVNMCVVFTQSENKKIQYASFVHNNLLYGYAKAFQEYLIKEIKKKIVLKIMK